MESRGRAIRFVMGGRVRSLENVPPTLTVLRWLRDVEGRVGTKEGCGEGDCGACTVLLGELVDGRLALRPVNACILFVPALHGRALLTIEDVAPGAGALSSMQRSLVRHHGSQCGFCTPGIVMALEAHLRSAPAVSHASVARALAGNLCRCTGYRPIVTAAMDAAGETGDRDPFESEVVRLLETVASDDEVVVAHDAQRWEAPTTLDALADRYAASPDALLVAGATDVARLVTKEHRRVPSVIHTGRVAELRTTRDCGDAWEFGAAVAIAEVGATLAGDHPDVVTVIDRFGSEQIRSVATLAGNLATASPVGDLAPVLLVLGATLVLRLGGRRRELPLDEFFLGDHRTALEPGELIAAVRVPRPHGGGELRAYKIGKRPDQDIATVSLAAFLRIEDATVRDARLAVGGVADRPCRVPEAEQALIGRPWMLDTVRMAADALDGAILPRDDVRGGAGYRRRALRGLLHKLWLETSGEPTERTRVRSYAAPQQARAVEVRGVGHDSAVGHVTGDARFVDDVPEPAGTLAAAVGLADRAHARLRRIDLEAVRRCDGVVAVVTADDVPGTNDAGTPFPGDPVLARDVVDFDGQVIFAVAATSVEDPRRAVRAATIEYEDLPAVLSVEAALARESRVLPSRTLARGDVTAAIAGAPDRMTGRLTVGGQEHWYLEGQIALVIPADGGTFHVHASTQHPGQVQEIVARVLGVPSSAVTVEVRRLGGGFGGKETQAAQFAAIAAVLARRTGRPVKLRLDRDDDMRATGKRHDFAIDWEVGFDATGRIRGLDVTLAARCGASPDLSGAVSDRAMLHCDNAYHLEAMRVVSHRLRSHTVSNTAFRGFGAPQAMLGMEEVIDAIARRLGRDPLDVRLVNLYAPGRDQTPYGMTVDAERLTTLVRQLEAGADYRTRRTEITAFNAAGGTLRRGLALTPVKFGISFVTTHLNQAGALVHVYRDGSVQLNHGGTEMGQGLHANIVGLVAAELGIDRGRVQVTAAHTGKVANASATAASSSTDLNGAAAVQAARTIKQRMADVAARYFAAAPEAIVFGGDRVSCGDRSIGFAELAEMTHAARVSLSATGFHRTPEVGWDADAFTGRPFLYFAYGAAVAEVVVDVLTGEHRVLRVDILHDCGRSLDPAIDRGQIEGGFVQGMGWLTTEELVWDEAGRLLTHSPSTYKIPTASDVPPDFRVTLFGGDPSAAAGVQGAKAVGEPPLMLAISVFHAIRDAVASTGAPGSAVRLDAPATPERVLDAIARLASGGAA